MREQRGKEIERRSIKRYIKRSKERGRGVERER